MIKIGLIGCGFMGSMHANAYNIIDGVQVTAVADIRPEKAEELFAKGEENAKAKYDRLQKMSELYK